MHSCNFFGMKMIFQSGEKGMAVTKGMIRTLLVLLFMLPAGAYALGLGDIKVRSSLEEPFDAEIALTSASRSVLDSLQVRLASSEDFARVGIKPAAAVKLLSFEVIEKPAGGAAIRITTPEPIHDPYLNFLIEANWGRGRVLREYTVLLDPPELTGEDTPIIEAPVVSATEPAIAAPPVVPDAPEPPAVVEPALPPVDDEGLIAPEIVEPEIIEPEIIEPEPLPEVLPPVAEEGLLEPAPEVIEPVFDEEAELPIAETEPVVSPGQGEPFVDVDDVSVGNEVVADVFAPLTYSVEQGDTLWSIAEQMRGDRSVSVYQVMMALFYNNPSAFIKDNLNNLKSGSILRIEDEAELSAIDKTTARNEFWQQYRAWQDYKQMLAKNVVTQGEDTGVAEADAGPGETADASAPAQDGPQLTLVSPDEIEPAAPAVADSAGSAEGEVAEGESLAAKSAGELQAMRDEILAEIEKSGAGSAQNQVLREKLAALEEQIASAQRVVSVKDTELAAMQQKVADANAAGLAGEAEGAEEGLMAKLNRSPQLMGVLGGVILLLLAWSWLMFRRRSEEKRAMATLVAAEDRAAFPSEEAATGSAVTEPGETVLSQVDAHVDAGKHAAAVAQLTDAIQREPDNEDYRYRLLEIHYEMKNKEGFSREAEALHSLTRGSDPVRWSKVAAMGAALIPAHALFSSAPAFGDEVGGDSGFSSGSADGAAHSGEWDDIESELRESSLKKDDEDQLIGEVLGDASTDTVAPVGSGTGQEDDEQPSDGAWDVEFQIDETDETSRTFHMEEEILDDQGGKPEVEEDIDFNLSDAIEARQVASSEDSVEPEEGADANGEVLAFTPRGGGEEASESPLGEAEAIEELASEAENIANQLSSEHESFASESEDELLELDEQLDEIEEQSFPALSEYDAMSEDDELLDDVDEIGTKLDLAKAYIEMGDAEAARNILDEVNEEGDRTQKQKAAELLGQISEAGGR